MGARFALQARPAAEGTGGVPVAVGAGRAAPAHHSVAVAAYQAVPALDTCAQSAFRHAFGADALTVAEEAALTAFAEVFRIAVIADPLTLQAYGRAFSAPLALAALGRDGQALRAGLAAVGADIRTIIAPVALPALRLRIAMGAGLMTVGADIRAVFAVPAIFALRLYLARGAYEFAAGADLRAFAAAMAGTAHIVRAVCTFVAFLTPIYS